MVKGLAGEVGDWYFNWAVKSCRKSDCVSVEALLEDAVLAVVEAATDAAFTELALFVARVVIRPPESC